ncbi:hypothetical protein CA951_03545 [Rhodococcus sp. NCIMB 12038]|nr:hypothetical protein CA951_03545 [Rhodococcus sp. NCIMB 12038]
MWSSVPRTVLAGGAAAVVAVVVILVITLSSGDGGAGGGGAAAGTENGTGAVATTPASKFVPDIMNAEFGDGWTDKTTKEAVTPPQGIKITGSLDLTEAAQSIGYGAAEQRLPKNANGATTDSSFPVNDNSVRMYTDTDNVLHLSWNCEFVAHDTDSGNCREVYHIAFDVSGSEPAILSTSNSVRGLPGESSASMGVASARVAVTDPSQLPESVVGRDKATGADAALLRVAAQPRETSSKVYFVVADSLKLYFGELEPSR